MDYDITENNYIEVFTTKDMTREALRHTTERLRNTRNMVVQGEGTKYAIMAGCVAEQACLKIFPELYQAFLTDYDFIYDDKKWECKSLRCQGIPALRYEMSFFDISEHQQCDWYIFARVLNEDLKFKKTWIVGYMTKSAFLKKCWVQEEGSVRESDGFVYPRKCWNIYIRDITFKPFTKEHVDEVLHPKAVGNFF